MNDNRILVWVTYTSIATMLTLILMIVYGSINIDNTKLSEWFAPSAITTLIGGLGGALAGTWLSGRHAIKLMEKQKSNEINEKKYTFNRMVCESLTLIISTKTSIMGMPIYIALTSKISYGTGEDSILLDEMDERSRTLRLYTVIQGDLKDLYLELDVLYSNVDEMVKSGIVDWDTYSSLNLFKYVFGKTKNIDSMKELATSSNLSDDELEKLILEAESETEELQYYRDVFNSRGDLTDLQNMALKYAEKLKNFQQQLTSKVKG